jgi:diguanylate cyclase (GGDEF)-like protein
MKKKDFLEKLEKDLSLLFVSFTGLLLILLIDVVDYTTDPLLDFSLFYLTPVVFCTWFGGRRMGALMAGISAISWLFAELLGGTMQENYLPYYYWDCFTRLSFYWVVAQLLASLRERLRAQRSLARTDSVTGSANARHFRELLERETQRFKRYGNAFTLVYFDLDHFKHINDTLGHATGDEVLKTIVTVSQQHLRGADIVARLGGDEFGVLMPETNAHQAKQAMNRLQNALLAAMKAHQWDVTFSMGGISCIEDTTDVLTLIQLADQLMYEVKNNGKNGMKHMTCAEAKKTLLIEHSEIFI